MNRVIIVILALSLFACTSEKKSNDENEGQAIARQENGMPPSVDDLFTQMDANNDGKLSKSEVKGPLQDSFTEIDTNGDGFLIKEEMENAPRPNHQGPPNGEKGGPPPRY